MISTGGLFQCLLLCLVMQSSAPDCGQKDVSFNTEVRKQERMSGVSATRLKRQAEQKQIINLAKGRQGSSGKIWNCEFLSLVALYLFPDAALNAGSVLGSMTGGN